VQFLKCFILSLEIDGEGLDEEAVEKLLQEQGVESTWAYKEFTCGKQGESTARKTIWARPRRRLEVDKVCCGQQALVYTSTQTAALLVTDKGIT